jgi:phosphate-selective porin OprO and OprP
VRTFRRVQVRAGRFKMPFSREQLTSASDLDFIFRSRAADLLSPGRSVGAALHGRIAGRVIGYEAGLFTRDGDVARFGSNPGAGPTVAARVTVKARRATRHALPGHSRSRRAGSMGDIEIGLGATRGDVREGLASLRGRLTSRAVFFSPVFVHGRRLRVGADLEWRPGPFGIRAELLRVDDERRGQGVTGETLPVLRAQGWYVTGTWAVAGRDATKMADKSAAFAGARGLELAVRAEQLSFGSVGPGAPDLRTPRAAHLATATNRSLTVGVNWSLNRLVRVQLNAIRERIDDPSRSGLAGPVASWSRVCRVQFTL